MGFRQKNQRPEAVWRKRFRPELRDAGVPDFVLDDEGRWNYVLLHGYDHESRWSPAWIRPEQARELLRLLGTYYENRVGLDLFRTLEERVAGG